MDWKRSGYFDMDMDGDVDVSDADMWEREFHNNDSDDDIFDDDFEDE